MAHFELLGQSFIIIGINIRIFHWDNKIIPFSDKNRIIIVPIFRRIRIRSLGSLGSPFGYSKAGNLLASTKPLQHGRRKVGGF